MYNSRGQESTPIAHGKLPTFFLNFSKKKQQTFSVCERAYVTQASIWGANSRGGGDNRSSRKNINEWLGGFHDVAARSWRRRRQNGGQRMISWCSIKFPPTKPSHTMIRWAACGVVAHSDMWALLCHVCESHPRNHRGAVGAECVVLWLGVEILAASIVEGCGTDFVRKGEIRELQPRRKKANSRICTVDLLRHKKKKKQQQQEIPRMPFGRESSLPARPRLLFV
jgi:hypothetical protein